MKFTQAIVGNLLICGLFGLAGCNRKQEAPPPAVTPSTVEPVAVVPVHKVEDTGTVKVELDFTVDHKAIISISGNEYSPTDFDQPITLKTGLHRLTVKQPGLELDPYEFKVEPQLRSIVRIQEPNRRAAEWIIKVGGRAYIFLAEGGGRDVAKIEDLPTTPFRVVTVDSFGSTQVTDEGLENLIGLKHLENLWLQQSTISDAGLIRIKSLLPQLRDLQISGVTDAGLKHLETLTSLSVLKVHRSPITDDGLRSLRGLSGLTALSLENTPITSAGLEHLQHLTKLNYLNLIDTKLDSEGLQHLSEWKELRELYLVRTEVLDAGLEYISGSTKLSRLGLAGTRVSDAGLTHLKGMKELSLLWLDDTQITDEGLLQLSTLTALQELHVERTKVSDVGLQQLSGLTKLWRVSLSGTAVSDAGLEHLKTLPDLRELYLGGTKVTDAGVAALKKSLPQCVVSR